MLFLCPDLITFYKIWYQPLVYPIAILPVDGLNTVHYDNLEECYKVNPETVHLMNPSSSNHFLVKGVGS